MRTHKATLSNKVFTENPLLDEIVYNARQLATGAVLKDEDKANNAETLESIQYGDILVAINRGNIKFENFQYDEYLLSKYYASWEDIQKYAKNNKIIPIDDRKPLLKIAIEEFLDNYEEYNNYYRMLHGLPDYDPMNRYEGLCIDINHIEYGTPTPVEYIHAFCINDNYTPIHELGLAEKNMLFENGTCEALINDEDKLASLQKELGDAWDLNKDGLYYLMHIGDREVDYYNARNAQKFALLYCPSCDSEEVKTRFKDLFEANRLYMLYTIYSDAYKLRSDYYDNFMMIFLILQTIIDMIVELPEYIIRRDIFDTRTCKYIFESNGVKYFKDIPLKYQISLVKNLNKLIKFKSTDKCIVDIVSVFGVENIEVFRYYILKDRLSEGYIEDSEGHKVPAYYDQHKEDRTTFGETNIVEDNDTNYDLKFIKVPMLDNYDNYIRKDTSVYTYDTMVEADAYWTGDKDYDSVKSDVKNLDFTVLRSKYYSIEAVIDLAKRNFTMVYFMNMLMYNTIDSSNLRVNLPNVSTSRQFELIDTILTLFSLSYIYYGVEDTILDTRAKAAQIMGFNMEADLGEIASWLRENHRGLHLKDLHIDTFEVPENGKIMSFNELEDMFFTNKDVYDHVQEVMINPPSKGIYDAYRHIYKALFTTDRNMQYFLVDDIPEEYKDYKTKFVEIPRRATYYCPNCYALVDLNMFIDDAQLTCPVCGKEIKSPVIEEYHNEQDYYRDYNWFIESAKYDTLYFVIRDDFDTSHQFDLYIKKDETSMECVGQIRMAYTYREFLRYKDATLYSYISRIAAITNTESRQEACVNAIQAIVSYLKDYIDQDGEDAIPLDTVFSGLPSISMDFIKKYVTEVIDFFKSFKIFTHGSSILYVIDNKFDNYVQLIEWTLFKYLLDKSEVIKIEDAIGGKSTFDPDVGKILLKGSGIADYLTHDEKFKMIDKVWFEISRLIQKQYNEYYNSDNYEQADLRIRDVCDRFNKYDCNDSVFTERYIQEIEKEAVDAILCVLVDLSKSDYITLEEALKLEYNQSFDEYYNEWLADIATIICSFEAKDSLGYQDDYIRSDFYDLYSLYPIIDGRADSKTNSEYTEKTKFVDSYSAIVTQEFPPHSFDE